MYIRGNNLISEDYLMHHGVKGMKWGVRHDPQPTGRMRRRVANQQYRQSVKAAGRKNIQAFRENYGSREARRQANAQFRSEVNSAKEKAKESFKLTDKQKQIAKKIAIGAAITGGVVLASYGAYKLGKLHSVKMQNMAAVEKFIQNNNVKLGGAYKGVNPGEIREATITNTKIGPHIKLKVTEEGAIKNVGTYKTSYTKDAGAEAINKYGGLHYKKDTKSLAKNYKTRMRNLDRENRKLNEIQKSALNDANASWSPWPEASHVKNPTGKNREYNYGAGTGISRIGKYKKYARVRVNSNTWKNRKY